MSRKNTNLPRTGYYASNYSKDYSGKRSTAPRRRRRRSSRGPSQWKKVLAIILAILVLGAAIFGIVKLVQNHKGSDESKTSSVSTEQDRSNLGSARVLTDEEAEAIRNSEAYKNIMANKEDYPEYLIDDLEANPEILDFVVDYLDHEPVGEGGLTAAEKKSAHPLFVQWDKRWGYSTYGESSLAISGCGPTALSMVAYSLTRDDSIDPYSVAQYAMDSGYYVNGVGTAWALMNEGAEHYGLTVTSQYRYTEEQMKEALDNGGMMILSVGNGDFTVHSGHFIVLYGYKNGKFQVNDPFSYTKSSKLWDYETLSNQTKNAWIFYKAGSATAPTTSTTTTTAATSTTTTTTYTTTTTAPRTYSSTTTTAYTTRYTTGTTTSSLS